MDDTLKLPTWIRSRPREGRAYIELKKRPGGRWRLRHRGANHHTRGMRTVDSLHEALRELARSKGDADVVLKVAR
jgi:hypothetical protein